MSLSYNQKWTFIISFVFLFISLLYKFNEREELNKKESFVSQIYRPFVRDIRNKSESFITENKNYIRRLFRQFQIL